MATWKSFEEIDAWQKARLLSREIYKVSGTGSFSKEYELRSQIRRASGSVMDNIAEGFDRGGKGEFIQFLAIAKGSAAEVKSQLYRAFDNDLINKTQFESLFLMADDVGKMIGGLIEYLNKSTIKGLKYKK